MMLPLSFSGHFTVDQSLSPDDGVAQALTSIAGCLQREEPLHLSRTEDRIEFAAGLFRLKPLWNQLNTISRGEITVKGQPTGLSVRYRLWFAPFVTLMTVGVALCALIIATAPLPIAGKLALVVTLWLWGVGANVATTAFHFRRFLRRAISVRAACSLTGRSSGPA